MTLSTLSSHLWDFSLRLYRYPGVEPLCLMLQNQWRADVNILFWLRWLETESMAINSTRIQLAEAHIATWNKDAVLPLRKLRMEMKQHYGVSDKAIEDTREAIKAAELQAERVVQIRLEKLGRTWLAGTERQQVVPGSNLAIYAHHLRLPPYLTQEMQQILCAIDKP
ncbi:TIGR02444 family protein [Marinimicrobium sp. ABcell2]|uniref:TIGR02444 family protein n=1 Tax=Marinimicrobium sp. ABcell2 TaxID=3069751 RepID=UPI0027AED59C|nr:TIGR02444 family protein [Marinimicrobium sp. ABcell2]MDQ2076118.1 TIGR02444 family protein [Marinimicrobium sp. ABcell2]